MTGPGCRRARSGVRRSPRSKRVLSVVRGGVEGAFGPDAPRVNGCQHRISSGPGRGISTAPPVPEFLEDAFGRPVGGGDSIGRAPVEPDRDGQFEPAPSDPWRDPMSGAQLGPPAIDPTAPEGPAPLPAERFSFRQALFDRRLRPSALIGLLVVRSADRGTRRAHRGGRRQPAAARRDRSGVPTGRGPAVRQPRSRVDRRHRRPGAALGGLAGDPHRRRGGHRIRRGDRPEAATS